eukprot:g7296.t1
MCFFQTVLAVPLRQGYGLTETCAVSCIQFWCDNTPASVGPPAMASVIRLRDWAEGNYKNSDKERKDVGMPRGEVLIGGPMVTQGYFIQNPENPSEEDQALITKNKEDFFEADGYRWFCSGDIGQITDLGTLQIVDRKKDLWKGPNGEYVALTKVESAAKLSPYVDMCCCYGKTGGRYHVLLIVGNEANLSKVMKEITKGAKNERVVVARNQMPALGILGGAASVNDPGVVAEVLASVQGECKKAKLLPFETPEKLRMVSVVWSPDNEMLTAALKMKRPAIQGAHQDLLDEMYAA